jgi:hypothetical protein
MNNAFTGPLPESNKKNRPGTKKFSKKKAEELSCLYSRVEKVKHIKKIGRVFFGNLQIIYRAD